MYVAYCTRIKPRSFVTISEPVWLYQSIVQEMIGGSGLGPC